MIGANTEFPTWRMYDQLPEHSYAIIASGQYPDSATSLWTLMTAQLTR